MGEKDISEKLLMDYVSDDDTEIKHVDEVLKLLSVVTTDPIYATIIKNTEEVHSMCEVAERLINKGKAEGRAEGENMLVLAIKALKAGKNDAEILAEGISEHSLYLAKTVI